MLREFGRRTRLKRVDWVHRNHSSHLTVTMTEGYSFLRSFNCREGAWLRFEWQPTLHTLSGNSASLVFCAVVHIRPAHDQKTSPPGACFRRGHTGGLLWITPTPAQSVSEGLRFQRSFRSRAASRSALAVHRPVRLLVRKSDLQNGL